ncbi:MAG: hypothetical protein R6U27_12680 [Desulfobacterales bacterium]
MTYETVLVVDNSDLSLRPGMTATAEIFVKEIENAILIPNAALRFKPTSAERTDRASSESIVSPILPGLHRSPPMRQENKNRTDKTKQQIWTILKGKPSPVAVTIGYTDGLMTQIIDGDIDPGMQLIIDVESDGR